MARKNSAYSSNGLPTGGPPGHGPGTSPANIAIVNAAEEAAFTRQQVSSQLRTMLAQVRGAVMQEVLLVQMDLQDSLIEDVSMKLTDLGQRLAAAPPALRPSLRRRGLLLLGQLTQLYSQEGVSPQEAAALADQVLKDLVPNWT